MIIITIRLFAVWEYMFGNGFYVLVGFVVVGVWEYVTMYNALAVTIWIVNRIRGKRSDKTNKPQTQNI